MKALFHHACRVEEEGGKYRPYRFTEAQLSALGKILPAFEKNGRCAAGISLKFETEAEEIAFSYEYTVFYTQTGGFDVYENGVLVESLALPQHSENGRFCYRKRAAGRVAFEIYLPANAEMTLWDFALGAWAPIAPQKKQILFYGDSLTQSAYTTTPSLSFVPLCARMLDADHLNRGIGSLFYDASYLVAEEIDADTVFVQFGGNDLIARTASNKVVMAGGEIQYRGEDEVPRLAENARAYLAKLRELFPRARLFVSTRIPHCEVLEGERKRANDAFNRAIRTVAKELGYCLVEGDSLLPHTANCRVEDGAHLNALGGAMMALELAKKLQENS